MAAVRRRHDGSPTRPTISGSRGRCSRSSGQVPAVLNSKPCLLAAPRNDNANRHSGPGCGYERPVPHDDEAGASGMVNAGRRLPLVPRWFHRDVSAVADARAIGAKHLTRPARS
jgi:hypothetical protein